MNAASRSVAFQRHPSRKPPTRSKVKPSKIAKLPTPIPLSPKTGGQKVQRLNTSRELIPGWLRSLILLQRCSDLMAFLLFAAILSVYSWTVYTQQQWTQEYRKLETLQRNERHLTTANESLKNELAQQAERPATGLVTPNTANTILLPPAPQRQFVASPSQTPDSESMVKTPLGY